MLLQKKGYDDLDGSPLSVFERWIFVGLLLSYLYIKYYKWYVFFFRPRGRRKKRYR